MLNAESQMRRCKKNEKNNLFLLCGFVISFHNMYDRAPTKLEI